MYLYVINSKPSVCGTHDVWDLKTGLRTSWQCLQHAYQPGSSPLAIKRGNGPFSRNGDFDGKIMYK